MANENSDIDFTFTIPPPTATLKRSGVISHVRITESSLVRYEVNSE